ncbi:MAG TPA: SDR family NAD(P)-dependent oxidoreductase [Patescibacteria group bacterium]|nr:SDR family NAD(P)-dependent oxidoreductase [Patescibacteria group bacterium]
MTKYAFVTGASRGLGDAFVKNLSNNYFVFAGVRSLDFRLQNPPNIYYFPLDVTDDDQINEAFKMISKKTKVLDLLINNAGINKDTATNNNPDIACKLENLEREILIKMFNTNAVSPLFVLKKFLPLLNSNPSFVINISSDRASFHDEFGSETGNYGYRASKVALNMYTFCSIADLPNTVKTFAVHPGDMKTDMNPDGTDDPAEQAEKIIAITKSWKEEFNGKFLRYDGNLYPL